MFRWSGFAILLGEAFLQWLRCILASPPARRATMDIIVQQIDLWMTHLGHTRAVVCNGM